MKTVTKMISTFFYLGYLPAMPGTIGSIGGVLFFLMVYKDARLYLISTVVLAVLGLLVINKAEEIFGKKDAKQIIIDEAVGILIAFLFVPQRPFVLLFAFVAFRIFDILKPYPIKKIEAINSPWGVMLDDAAAGIYANLAAQIFAILAVKIGV